jgi:hypothetical protein
LISDDIDLPVAMPISEILHFVLLRQTRKLKQSEGIEQLSPDRSALNFINKSNVHLTVCPKKPIVDVEPCSVEAPARVAFDPAEYSGPG